MQIQYITEPLEQYISRTKTSGMKYTRTSYHCPLCKAPIPKRDFEEHVFKEHPNRSEEAFALLYGLPYPVRCSCGKELHYSEHHRGFPKMCGSCSTGCISEVNYKNAEDAHKHAEQLKQLIAHAKAEEIRLKREAELSRIPLKELTFPSRKYVAFLKRLSMDIRCFAINGEKDKLLGIANFIDNKVAD